MRRRNGLFILWQIRKAVNWWGGGAGEGGQRIWEIDQHEKELQGQRLTFQRGQRSQCDNDQSQHKVALMAALRDWKFQLKPGLAVVPPLLPPAPLHLFLLLLVVTYRHDHTPLVRFAAKALDYTSNNPNLWLWTPAKNPHLPQQEINSGRGLPQILNMTNIALKSHGFNEMHLCQDNSWCSGLEQELPRLQLINLLLLTVQQKE